MILYKITIKMISRIILIIWMKCKFNHFNLYRIKVWYTIKFKIKTINYHYKIILILSFNLKKIWQMNKNRIWYNNNSNKIIHFFR